MRTYIARRILHGLLVLLLVSFAIFSLVRILPGDAVLMQLDQAASPTPEMLARARQELGLDRPFLEQYRTWMAGVVRGDLGHSLTSRRPVTQELLKRVSLTSHLAVMSMIIALLIALPIGVLAAVRQDTAGDYVGRLFAILGLSLPDFWLATVAITFLSIWLQWMPPIGFAPIWEDPARNLSQLLIPALIIGARLAAVSMRMTRSSLLEVLRQDYIVTARAEDAGRPGHARRQWRLAGGAGPRSPQAAGSGERRDHLRIGRRRPAGPRAGAARSLRLQSERARLGHPDAGPECHLPAGDGSPRTRCAESYRLRRARISDRRVRLGAHRHAAGRRARSGLGLLGGTARSGHPARGRHGHGDSRYRPGAGGDVGARAEPDEHHSRHRIGHRSRHLARRPRNRARHQATDIRRCRTCLRRVPRPDCSSPHTPQRLRPDSRHRHRLARQRHRHRSRLELSRPRDAPTDSDLGWDAERGRSAQSGDRAVSRHLPGPGDQRRRPGVQHAGRCAAGSAGSASAQSIEGSR